MYDAILQDAFKYTIFDIEQLSESQYITEIKKCQFLNKIKNN